jgi:dienelactone hydrolase
VTEGSGSYEHLGEYSGLVSLVQREVGTVPQELVSRHDVLTTLGVPQNSIGASEVRVERSWDKEALHGEEISWSVGFGPRTHAWLLRRRDLAVPAPGILALHDHANIKYYGKEKIADDDGQPAESIRMLRDRFYGGRAFANELAMRGFVVLCHDVFLWGSRCFDYASIPERIRRVVDDQVELSEYRGKDISEHARYEIAARLQEDVVAKYCSALSTSIVGLVLREDMIALAYLQSREDVAQGQLGCVGLSGGGNRAGYLRAASDAPVISVLAGCMATLPSLLDRNVANHSWLLFPPGLAALCDWPELVASGKPAPLLIQYNEGDSLFPLGGMKEAHRRLLTHSDRVSPSFYMGEFFPGPHKFDAMMQDGAFTWMAGKFSLPASR